MANLRSDSPICRRIVIAFLDFLKSVQPAPGVDYEGLDVVRECLEEVFKLSLSSNDDGIQPGVLIDLFSSWEAGEQCEFKSHLGPAAKGNTSCTTSASQQNEDSNDLTASNTEDQVGTPNVLGGDSKDELFGKFCAALDKINFFKTSPGGVKDPAQIVKATQFFNDALEEMGNSKGQIINLSNLAETFKLRGNKSMLSNLHSEAIELYTCAIALSENNAVYYCNRAAAFTQIQRYTEAIEDCLKSIEIDPSYSKAYSRLGLAYYAQGNYSEALNKGFLKALQLDPNNNTVKENIRVAQQKLMEQHQRAEADRNTGLNHGQESTTQSAESTNRSTPFTSFSFNASIPPFRATTQSAGSTNHSTPSASFSFNASTPPEFANLFRTMASATQGHQPHERRPSGNPEESNEPEIRMDANNTGSNHGPESTTQSAGSTNRRTPFTFFPFSPPTPPTPPTPEFPDIFRTTTHSAGSANFSAPFASFPFNASIPSEFPNTFRTTTQSAGSTNRSTPGASFPFDASTPTEFADLFRTMASAAQGHWAHERSPSGNSEAPDEPEIRIDANVNLHFDEAPEQVSDVLRSVMGMFSSQRGPQQDMPRGGSDRT